MNLLLTLLLATAIANANTLNFSTEEFEKYAKNDLNFQISIPENAIYKFITGIKSFSYSDVNLRESTLDTSNFRIELYPKYQFKTCPDIGVTKPDKLVIKDNTQVARGKVDYFDFYTSTVSVPDYPAGFDDTLCRPLSAAGVAYAFCAQKNEKVAVVCISQSTDNPQQAKEIFESFKWLEDEEITSSSNSLSSEPSQSSASSTSSITPPPPTEQAQPIQSWYTRFWQWLWSWL